MDLPTENLSPQQHKEASCLLNRWRRIFSTGLTDLGCINLVKPFTKSAYIGARIDQGHTFLTLIKTSNSFREPTIFEIRDGLVVSELELLEFTFESSFCSTTKTRSSLTDRQCGLGR